MAVVAGLEAKLREWSRERLDESIDKLVDTLKERCPVSDDGVDHMVDHIERTPVRELGDKLTAQITVDVDYAEFTDEGTDPHPIYGRPWLAFEVDGETVILNAERTPVMHPGTEGTHWWTDSLDEWEIE